MFLGLMRTYTWSVQLHNVSEDETWYFVAVVSTYNHRRQLVLHLINGTTST